MSNYFKVAILSVIFAFGVSQPAKAADNFQIHAGTGLSSYLGSHGFVFNGSFIYGVPKSRFFMGVETGFHILSVSPTIVVLPILPTVYYVLPIQGSVKPYIGTSLGPVINLDNNPTGFALGMYFRPGLIIPVGKKLNVHAETRIGAIDGALNIVTQANLAFPL